MASLRDIKKRIQSIENIKKITKAMKMVSAAKLKKSQRRMYLCGSCLKSIENMIRKIVNAIKKKDINAINFFYKRRNNVKVSLMSITSDRGLCGSFNNNIMRKFRNFIFECDKKFPDVSVINIGKKGAAYLISKMDGNRDIRFVDEKSCLDKLSLAKNLSQEIYNDYIQEKIGNFYITHGTSENAALQDVRIEKVLPIDLLSFSSVEEDQEYIYEPSTKGLLEKIIPEYLSTLFYKIFLESEVSEHSARMKAMEGATKNSEEICDLLTLQYNRARQANITRELVEIISGAEALK